MTYDLEDIKAKVPMPNVVAYFAELQGGKTPCLWHPDGKNPNLQVYDDHVFCWSCRHYADIFEYVETALDISFAEAVEWIIEKEAILPKGIPATPAPEYKGPVPLNYIEYWHSQLTPDRREGLYKRLLTDETIDLHMLGWRPDYAAYVIPFWRGFPQISKVDVVQFRSTENSPVLNGRIWKYTGMTGHNRPSILNRHLINSTGNVLLFGTFDALLASQDGIAAVSTNGATVFGNTSRPEFCMLQESFSGTKAKILVPDGTFTELEPASSLAMNLGFKLGFFKPYMPKDYNDCRLAGYSYEELLREVFMNEYRVVYAIRDQHVVVYKEAMDLITRGNWQKAMELIQVAQDEGGYSSFQMSHTLQMLCIIRNYPHLETFTDDEWKVFCRELGDDQTYGSMSLVLIRWAELALSRLGAF